MELRHDAAGRFDLLHLLPTSLAFGAKASPCFHGRFGVAVGVQQLPAILISALHTSWLGPGLIIGFVLLITLRRARTAAYKPLHRAIRRPHIERYSGVPVRRHRDLEV